MSVSVTKDLFKFDLELKGNKEILIAGVDEAGRGPLAGPVVCACCIMPLDDDSFIDKINDSKKLSEKVRNELYEKIIATAIAYSIAVIDNQTIDEINILQATIKGAVQAINEVKSKQDSVLFLVDALNLNIPNTDIVPIIKGDAKSYNIAAASILAKVMRDRILQDYDLQYPSYGFSRHKGYGTMMHINAIKEHGITKIHRRSFVKKYEHEYKG